MATRNGGTTNSKANAVEYHNRRCMFTDRTEAGKLLAAALEEYRGKEAIILALPRGGVVIGYEIAIALGLPLDIIAVRKVGHPMSPEYAVGAVDDVGTLILNESETATLDQKWRTAEIGRQQAEAKRRAKVYRGKRKPMPIKGKVAIIVDDGAATGLTMRLAIKAVRHLHPLLVVVALPVISDSAAADIRKEADELIVLVPPEEFADAVGAHYVEFPQVEDEEVIRLLRAGDSTKSA